MRLLLAFAIVTIASFAQAEPDPCANNPNAEALTSNAESQNRQVAALYQRWRVEPRGLKTGLEVLKFADHWRETSACTRSLVEDRTRRLGDDLVAKVSAKQAFVLWTESDRGRQKVVYDGATDDAMTSAVSAKPPKASQED